MALGALFSGCQFLSWYPITPASSLAETFEKFANVYQRDKEGKKKFLVLQSEDELSAVTQAIGAGWAGLRAMTATSSPGLSLMSEGAGLSYFAEIPTVYAIFKEPALPQVCQRGHSREIFWLPVFYLMETVNILCCCREILRRLFILQQRLLIWRKNCKLLSLFK